MINTKFRTRPVVIEAFQWTTESRKNCSSWPAWLEFAWNLPDHEMGSLSTKLNFDSYPPTMYINKYIKTLEGNMEVNEGDYIIKGIKGELSPCKEDIFLATYEEVLDPSGGTTTENTFENHQIHMNALENFVNQEENNNEV